MDYIKKKREVALLSNLVIREYNDLLPKVLLLCKEMGSVAKSKLSFKEQCDFASFITGEENIVKATSLINALLYVENPRNKRVVNALKLDMDYNKRRRKSKK